MLSGPHQLPKLVHSTHCIGVFGCNVSYKNQRIAAKDVCCTVLRNLLIFVPLEKETSRLFYTCTYEVCEIVGTVRAGVRQPPGSARPQGSSVAPIPVLWQALAWLAGGEGQQRVVFLKKKTNSD